MSGNGHRLIAREGIPVLAVLLILVTAAYVFLGLFFSLFIFIIFVLAVILFRDPKCEVPAAPLAVLSPASGQVLSITQTEDPWLCRPATRIRLHINLWDPHSLRSPIEGKVMNQWSSSDGKQEFARQYAWWIQTDEGDDLLLALGMNAGAIFSRMSIHSGQRTGQGQRCGFLYFTGIIDVYLPENSRISVEAGDRVMSGAAILGQFVHGEGASAVTAN